MADRVTPPPGMNPPAKRGQPARQTVAGMGRRSETRWKSLVATGAPIKDDPMSANKAAETVLPKIGMRYSKFPSSWYRHPGEVISIELRYVVSLSPEQSDRANCGGSPAERRA